MEDLGCRESASASVTILPDPLPPSIGPSLRVAKSATDGVMCTWTDIAGTWGDYELVTLAAALGPPTPATMDSLASVLASAAPGVQSATDPAGQRMPQGLVFLAVRATSPGSGRAGPTTK